MSSVAIATPKAGLSTAETADTIADVPHAAGIIRKLLKAQWPQVKQECMAEKKRMILFYNERDGAFDGLQHENASAPLIPARVREAFAKLVQQPGSTLPYCLVYANGGISTGLVNIKGMAMQPGWE